MKRRGLALLMAAVLGILTGCGSGGGTDGAAAPDAQAGGQGEEQTGTAAAEEEHEQVELSFTYWGGSYEQPLMEKLIADFEEAYPYIEVDSQHIPSDYEAKMSAMVAGQEEPDIAYIRDYMALDFAEQGMLYNIFDFIDQDEELDREDFVEDFYLYWDEGKSYGMYMAGESYALFYNTEAFEEAGVDPLPTTVEDALTWEELVDVAQRLTIDQNGNNAQSPDFDPEHIRQYGIRFDFNQGSYMPLVHGNGGTYMTEDGKFGLAQEEGLDVIEKMGDLVTKYHVAPSPAETKSLPSTAVSLTTRQSAIIMIGQWVLLDLGESGVDFGVGVLPEMNGEYSTSPGWGTVGIFESTEHPEEAWLLWKWLADPSRAIEAYQSGLWMPLMTEWYTNEDLLNQWAAGNIAHPEGYKEAVMEPALNHFHRHPSAYVKNFAEIDALVTPALERMYLGEESAQEAMEGIADQAEALFEGLYE